MLGRIEAAVAAADQAAMLALWRPTEVECTLPLQGVDAPVALCAGAEPGEKRAGYLVGNESRFVAEPASSIGVVPRGAADAISSYKAATIGCPSQGTRLDCSRRFIIVFRWVDRNGARFFNLYECDSTADRIISRRLLLDMPGSTEVLSAGGNTGTHPLLPDDFTFALVR